MRSELVVLVCLFVACGKQEVIKRPAATVQNRIAEGDLTTITLTEQAEKRLGIETKELVERVVPRERTVAGEVMIPPGKSLVVSAPMAGVAVLPPTLIAGARVKKGQLLMRLAPLPTAAELNAAEARLDIAKKRATRNEQLVKEGAVAQRANEDAQMELALAEANLAAVRPGAGGRASIPLLAPRDGVVRDLRIADGQTVAAGLPMFQLDALEAMWVRAAIPANVDASRGSVQSLDGHTRRELSDVVAPPSADLLSATVDRYFALENSDGAFRPGQRVLVSLKEGASKSQVVVPSSALMIDLHGGEWIYASLGEHRFSRRRVSVRFVDGNDAVLAQSPAVGTKVVTVGATELFGVEFGAGK